jgi:hypothetical protein
MAALRGLTPPAQGICPAPREPAPCKASETAHEGTARPETVCRGTVQRVRAYAGRALRDPVHREAADRLARILARRASRRMAVTRPPAVPEGQAEAQVNRASLEAPPRARWVEHPPASRALRERRIPPVLLQQSRGKGRQAQRELPGSALPALLPRTATLDSLPPVNRERRTVLPAMVPAPLGAAMDRRLTRRPIR